VSLSLVTALAWLAGKNQGTIERCHVSGIVKGYGTVGGMIGYKRVGLFPNAAQTPWSWEHTI